MIIRIRQLVLPITHSADDLRRFSAKRLRCNPDLILNVEIERRSIDARQFRKRAVFVCSVLVEIEGFARRKASNLKDVELDPVLDPEYEPQALPVAESDSGRPVIIGAGPAGIFAALILAEAGLEPFIIERGSAVAKRRGQVADFWQNGKLDASSNVLFGEGGAGLFSDGKLTNRSKDRARTVKVLETFVDMGADPDILIEAEPHLGTDVLAEILPAMRAEIMEMGGEFVFETQVDGFVVEDGALEGLVIGDGCLPVSRCILATGASARDTFEALCEAGAGLEAKSFAVGVRAEMPQVTIDMSQWGKFAGDDRLGPANFRMSFKKSDDLRSCYTFCMCPGGSVICCAVEDGELTTNGMSLSARGGAFGNAAFIVPVTPDDFPDSEYPPLAGVEFQRMIERAAFAAGGSDFSVPAQMLSDFVKQRPSGALPDERSLLRAFPGELNGILPEYVSRTLREAIPEMIGKMQEVNPDSVVLYGVETRSSSPVRIIRSESGECSGIHGLFPAGEGSGYAGGIMSSAIDGIKAAEFLIRSL